MEFPSFGFVSNFELRVSSFHYGIVPLKFSQGLCLGGTNDFAGFQALGADFESLGSIIIGYSDGLQIGQPSSLGLRRAKSP